MIQVSNLSKSYGPEPLFDEATFSITYGERLGLIGRNGHGKTTLLKILAGTEELDSGKVIYPDGYKVGVLSQHLHFTEDTVLEEACLGLPELEGGWKETYKAEAVLLGLGFSKDDFEKSPQALSGGYQIRLNLTKLLISEPNLLLLDEPTNYLDIVSMRWLTTFMKEWPGELLIITHDHDFMDSITTHTLGIHRAKVRKIAGGTKKFYNQIAIEEEVHEQSRLNQEKKIQQAEVFIRTFRAKASKAKAVQSRIKAVEKMDRKEKLDEIYDLDFDFNYFESPAKKLLEVENLGFGYEKGGELLFSGLKFTVNAKDRIAVIGKNGKGKSTLLNLIAENLKPVEGEIKPSPNMRLGYFGQTNIERLDPNRTIEEELLSCTPTHNRTLARCIAGAMMFEGDNALKKIKVLSGGEKSRVFLGKIILTPANLLLLDEPTNHLDMQSTDALLSAIDNFPGAIIMVTHSEMFLRTLATRLIIFDRGKARLFEGTYDDFLRRVGWEDEPPVKGKGSSGNDSGLSKKELRKQRAELNKKKSLKLKPLQHEVNRLEKKILELEAKVAEDTENLIELTKDGFGETAVKATRELHLLKQEIEELYAKLEEATSELESVEKELLEDSDSE